MNEKDLALIAHTVNESDKFRVRGGAIDAARRTRKLLEEWALSPAVSSALMGLNEKGWGDVPGGSRHVPDQYRRRYRDASGRRRSIIEELLARAEHHDEDVIEAMDLYVASCFPSHGFSYALERLRFHTAVSDHHSLCWRLRPETLHLASAMEHLAEHVAIHGFVAESLRIPAKAKALDTNYVGGAGFDLCCTRQPVHELLQVCEHVLIDCWVRPSDKP